MKKSKKSIAVVFAMILGCLPKNSLAAPKNNSLANEDNSLASGKPESVGGAEQRSKKMSNSTKISLGLSVGEVGLETFGWFFPKLWTPGKGVAEAVWMFSDQVKKIEKKVKKIGTVDELRAAIKDFARTKKSDTTEEQKQSYKKMLASVYKKYDKCRRDLFYNYHDKKEMEHEGFKVVSSVYGPWMQGKGTKDDYCVFMLKPGVAGDLQIRNFLNEIPQWKVLCDAAARLKQKIVIGIGLHEFRNGFDYVNRNLEGYINIGLKGDKSCFEDNGFSIFDFTFYDGEKGINNLGELNKLLAK